MGALFVYKMALMYFFLCIPLFFYALASAVGIRVSERKVRRCFNCGHIGRMEPYLQGNKPCLLTVLLLCAGLVPGLWYLSVVKDKYRCSRCGKITGHLGVSDSLARRL